MRTAIGFALLTFNNPDQTLFLSERLTALFDHPPIVIHHDFGQCRLDVHRFPPNVSFVKDWSPTRWGGSGVVDGLLKAIRLLYETNDPDWFVVLSGADYPIKSATAVLSDLETGGFDAYIDHRRIERCDLPIPAEGWGDQNYIHPAWIRLAFERYMAIGFGFYKLATALKWRRKAIYLRSDFFIKRLTPFDGTLHCYAGDFWFTANRKAARALLEDTLINHKIIAHFRRRPNPDEGLFQTLFGNAKDLKLSTDNKRYTDWRECVNHPRTLGEEDFPALLASGDHFARKFAFDPGLLRKLDELVDSHPAVRATIGRSSDSSNPEMLLDPSQTVSLSAEPVRHD